MRIRHISIRNFRGIRELDWTIPDKTLFCLIGALVHNSRSRSIIALHPEIRGPA